MKECCWFKQGKCNQMNPQPEGNFSKDRKRKDGLTIHCKTCLTVIRAGRKEYNEKYFRERKKDPAVARRYYEKYKHKIVIKSRKWREKNLLQSRYNMSNEEWQNMFEKQKGLCPICLRHAKDFKKALHVDHCHSTNKIRGLLCSVCNQAIGMFKDNIEALERAISYIKGELA